jgi:hypothetical protein
MEVAVPLTGIDIGASDSPVKLSVIPPDLEQADAPGRAPAARDDPVRPAPVRPETEERHARATSSTSTSRARWTSPRLAVVKTIARVSSRVRDRRGVASRDAALVIDTEGAVTSIRVMRPSGNAKFDGIVLECVRDEWQFSRRSGRGRRCAAWCSSWSGTNGRAAPLHDLGHENPKDSPRCLARGRACGPAFASEPKLDPKRIINESNSFLKEREPEMTRRSTPSTRRS